MPDYRRAWHPGGTYFLLSICCNGTETTCSRGMSIYCGKLFALCVSAILNPGRVFTLDGRIKHSRIALFFISQRLRFMTAG
jgi:hypothetical protein